MQIFVDQVIVRLPLDRGKPAFKAGQDAEAVGAARRQLVEQGDRRLHDGFARLIAFLLQQAADMAKRDRSEPAGLRIIADIDKAAGRGGVAEAADERRAHRRRDPAIDAVQRHIIELSERGGPLLRQRDKVAVAELDVGETSGLRHGAAMVDMFGQEIDADELPLRIGGGQQAQAHALAASQLQIAEGRVVAGPGRRGPRHSCCQVEPVGRYFRAEAIGVAGRGIIAVKVHRWHDRLPRAADLPLVRQGLQPGCNVETSPAIFRYIERRGRVYFSVAR